VTEELLDREDVDAVIISASTPVHAELALAATATGKHFYLEKPIATNVEDAREVVAAAAQAGITTAMGFNWRRHPLYEHARTLLLAGRVGRVRAVHTAFCEPAAPEAMPAWKQRRATGGGVLLDLASHHVDSLRWLLGAEIDVVEASVTSELSEHDEARIRLSLTGGATVQGFYSFRAAYADFLEIIGEQGTLRIDRHRATLELWVVRGARYGLRRAWAPSRDVAAWRLAGPLRRGREVSFRRSLEGFVECVRGRPCTVASLEDGLRSLEVVVAAEVAALDGVLRAPVTA